MLVCIFYILLIIQFFLYTNNCFDSFLSNLNFYTYSGTLVPRAVFLGKPPSFDVSVVLPPYVTVLAIAILLVVWAGLARVSL